MSTPTAVVAVVAILVLGLIVVVAIRTPGEYEEKSYPTKTPSSNTPMWATVSRYGPSCGSVKVVDDKYVKYCDLEAEHVGDHVYKYITLEEETNREDLS